MTESARDGYQWRPENVCSGHFDESLDVAASLSDWEAYFQNCDSRRRDSELRMDTQSGLQQMCWDLFECVRQNPHDHLNKLNQHLAPLLCLDMKIDSSKLQLTRRILRRLPEYPASSIKLDAPYRDSRPWAACWESQYMLPNIDTDHSVLPSPDSDDISTDALEAIYRENALKTSSNLQVTRVIDMNSVAVAHAIARTWTSGGSKLLAFSQGTASQLSTYVNLLADLCEAAMNGSFYIFAGQVQVGWGKSNEWVEETFGSKGFVDDGDMYQSRHIVCLYLWAAWQRTTMLLHYQQLGLMLPGSTAQPAPASSVSKGNKLLVHVYRADYKDEGATPPYMCPWAISFLRTRKGSLGLDVRCVLDRFDAHFGSRKGRCDSTRSLPCKGRSSEECQRFLSSTPLEQHTAHDWLCQQNACRRIPWNEASYRQTEKPGAVQLSSFASAVDAYAKLEYCQANSQTLAISHVWSHGQGGRPEEGLHECLHRRYCTLARYFNCDSYWIDTACIPTDTTLRAEAIMSINKIFQGSKVTVVCDIDVMDLEVDDSPTLAQWETLVSTLLVSDWNVRAWTLLEAVMGSSNIHVLTKFNRPVALINGMSLIYREGPISLAVLLAGLEHSIPPRTRNGRHSLQGFEQTGHILSHRHATRKGDDVVIWSLMCLGTPYRSIEPFVVHVRYIRTGFLISSSPRSEQENFTWAPQSPRLRKFVEFKFPIREEYLEVYYPTKMQHSYEGEGSLTGTASAHGFLAKWFVLCFDSEQDFRNSNPWEEFGHKTWETVHSLFEGYKSVCLLKCVASDGKSRWVVSENRNLEDVPKVVVCASNCGNRWYWKGVYEEPASTAVVDGTESTPWGSAGGSKSHLWSLRELLLV